MTRRKPYSKVKKTDQIRAEHVKGMGDVVFVGFQCLNPECTEFISAREDEIDEDFEITCPRCGCVHSAGGETRFYDYEMVVNNHVESTGYFAVLHDEYIASAERYKYCIVCNTLKPLWMFDKHSARKSGKQGECRLCKKAYNEIKNGTRTTDQHREAAQKRRMLIDISKQAKINGLEVFNRYNGKCFNCETQLDISGNGIEWNLDHTLPAYYLWPMTTETATLLCRDCNGEKSGKWPSQFYTDQQLRKLAVITGIDYDTLAGDPFYNPDAMEGLKDPSAVDKLFEKYAPYMDELIKLRNRILRETGYDFFTATTRLSQAYIDQADDAL